MKALTLHQPYASLVAHGHKSIETRSWQTHYRGSLAIHAGRRKVGIEEGAPWGPLMHPTRPGLLADHVRPLPLGAVVATCQLAACVPIIGPCESRAGLAVRSDDGMLWMTRDGDEIPPWVYDQIDYGDFAPGGWAWLLVDIRRLDPPVPAKGRQGLWEWTP